ncbi:unnamed protein product [Prorocentrum cordatum]|uniref:Sodium/hydrogen exchanger n=1 Tax=Prorocentrum cordatum TaxID=2364126 RepID=A0ABN9SFW9_9DINO|nr:unnamed protein product [Polarella glacialis]
MQIQGESLLNDGSAMVLFTVAYQMLAGESWDFGDVSMFMLTNTLFAWMFGMSVGAVYYVWIRLVKNKFDHSAGMLQVALTILCAYSSFGIAEGILHVNGVLATVASSLFLARFMWPQIVDKHSLHMVWEMFGYLGNSVVFFLAGALVGNAMLSDSIVTRDYVDLLLIYLFLSLVRLGVVFVSRPLLRILSIGGDKPVTWQQAVLISHAGLRGAVGLALAVHVHHDRATNSDGVPSVSSEDADRVLFYVGGVALLTIVVNAPTSPMLVRKLKLSTTPVTRRQIMSCLHKRLQNIVSHGDPLTAEVQESLYDMLQDVLLHVQPRSTLPRMTVTSGKLKLRLDDSDAKAPSFGRSNGNIFGCSHVDTLLNDLDEQRQKFDKLCEKTPSARTARTRIEKVLPMSCLEDRVKELRGKMFEKDFDGDLACALNITLLHIVREQYWHQLQDSFILVDEFETLSDTIVQALSHRIVDKHGIPEIGDFAQLLQQVNSLEEIQEQAKKRKSLSWAGAALEDTVTQGRRSRIASEHTWMYSLVSSMQFQIAVYALVLANIALIVTEQYKGELMSSEGWFALDVVFCVGFTVEAYLNFLAVRRAYFDDPWNLFDFGLVIVGWIGAALNCAQLVSGESVQTSQSQVGRVVKFMKALRLLRFLRLVKMTLRLKAALSGKDSTQMISDHMKEHLKNFAMLQAFVKGHTSAQEELLRFFGKAVAKDSTAGAQIHYDVDIPEVATCLLQSKIAVARARRFAAMVWAALHPGDAPDMWCLEEERECYLEMGITKKLIDFVEKAERTGAISAADAETLVDPMQEHFGAWAARAEALRSGEATPDATQSPGDGSPMLLTPQRAAQPTAAGPSLQRCFKFRRAGPCRRRSSELLRCSGPGRPSQSCARVLPVALTPRAFASCASRPCCTA